MQSNTTADLKATSSLTGTEDLRADLYGNASAGEQHRPWTLLFLSALALTLLVGATVALIEWKYYSVHPYFFDPVAYQLGDASVYENVIKNGRWQTAWQELASSDATSPLRTLPLVVLAPNCLASPLGQCAITIPAFFCCVWLFGISALRRSGSLIYAIATMLIFSALPCLYSPMYGLGAYWLDVLSALLLGCAALTMANYVDTSQNKWLVFFSLFVSAAAFSRYVSIVYALVAFYPPLVFVMLMNLQRQSKRDVLIGLITVTLLPLLVSGFYLASRAAFIYSYYTNFGYALKQPISIVIQSSLSWLETTLFSKALGTFVLAAIVVNLASYAIARQKDARNLIVALCPPVAFVLFAVFVLRSSQNGYILWHVVPLLMTAAFIPIASRPIAWTKWHHAGCACLILASIIFGAHSIRSALHMARRPSPEKQGLKKLDLFLANKLQILKPGEEWATFFDEYGAMPTMEHFYKTKQLRPARGLFTVHMSYWSRFKAKSLESLCQSVYADTKTKVKLACVFENPKAPFARDCYWIDNLWSKTVASFMASKLKSDPQFRKIDEFDAYRFGKIALYENMAQTETPALESQTRELKEE